MTEIPKAYDPQAVEDKWYQFWLDQQCFVADPARVSSTRPAYSIVIPPPNVTGVLTMGHVLNNTIQDILARKARMDGKEVLWLPGTDHAGIATQTVVERTLKKSGAIRHRDDLGREKFLEKVWEWKEKHGGIIIEQLRKLGASCDWTRERFTMDPAYSRCVQKVFVDLYHKGLIYRGKRMVNWCPVSLTALSDEEVIMKEQNGLLYYFKVEVAEEPGTFLTVATTRPETIPADTAVAVNPKDPRYAHLIGKHVIRALPVEQTREERLIPIVGDESVDFEFGTGVLKVTPAHDKTDFEIGLRHGLPVIDILHPNATLNELAGRDLAGLDRVAARKKAAEVLEAHGALAKTEPYVNKVGYSERADVPIEPRLSEQWFLKYPSVEASKACVGPGESECAPGGKNPLLTDLQEEKSASQPAPDAQETGDALSLVPHRHVPEDMVIQTTPPAGQSVAGSNMDVTARMRFHPDRWTKTYTHWMANIRDWCISRQLWWGHRIPVWYNRLTLAAVSKTTRLVELTGQELQGSNVRELRAAAWELALSSGFLRQRFRNLDTGWDIYVNRASLEHGFANHGLANIKLVPALPDLLRHSILIDTEPHIPARPQFKWVHRFLAAVAISGQQFRVKFTVKELFDGRKLYDHQALALKGNEADGESPGTHPLAEKLVTRPTSASQVKIADLLDDVNNNERFVRCQIECPGEGWGQDPDVLDTWFSSWLWPFATMGWTGDQAQDSNNPTLKAFYPTTDLVTGPDIIFFWVARMIMAGYEYLGEMPFRNVYFTGIIRDKQGRKMSKSLGNSPDPLDLIAKFGADALRFGTMRSAPLGQDILFDEQNVELGRNFCNKLWNACRFRQMQGGAAEGEINPALLTSDDRWILLRLDQAVREVTQAFADYRFSDATNTLYRFFWGEYCDWYVEASKAALAGRPGAPGAAGAIANSQLPIANSQLPIANSQLPIADSQSPMANRQPHPSSPNSDLPSPISLPSAALAANKLAVIDFVLGHTLRLFHPFLPFITEELWQGMGYAQDMPADQGGRTIMFAPWPKPFTDDEKAYFGLDEAAERAAAAKYEMVSLGRNLKREFNLPANKKVSFVLRPSGELPAPEAEVVKLLLNAESLTVVAAYDALQGTPSARGELGELFLPLTGLIDLEAERTRLTKELEKARAEVAKVEQKLANPSFTQKVPAAVLEEHQRRLGEWQEKVRQAELALSRLG